MEMLPASCAFCDHSDLSAVPGLVKMHFFQDAVNRQYPIDPLAKIVERFICAKPMTVFACHLFSAFMSPGRHTDAAHLAGGWSIRPSQRSTLEMPKARVYLRPTWCQHDVSCFATSWFRTRRVTNSTLDAHVRDIEH
jgi:hypothetical protein